MKATDDFTAIDVAQWMIEELNRLKCLYQQEAVWQIEQKFGKRFVYENAAGNMAIDKKVLAAFKGLTANAVVWERGERMWRKRLSYDSSGRQQA